MKVDNEVLTVLDNAEKEGNALRLVGQLDRNVYTKTNKVLEAAGDFLETEPQRIYISGPMTGIEDLNFPAFHAEAKRLRGLGYEVVNPAELVIYENSGWLDCMKKDIAKMLTCEAICLLDGWQNSDGANLEVLIAHRLGIKILIAKEVIA